MAKREEEPPKVRAIVEHVAEFNTSSSIRSLAISSSSSSSSSSSTNNNNKKGQQTTVIYAGTNTGTLLLLSLNPDSSSISLQRYVSIAQSPIVDIHIVNNNGSVVLCGGSLYLVHSDHLLPTVSKLLLFRGAAALLKDVSAFAPRVFTPSTVASTSASSSHHHASSSSATTALRFLHLLGGGGVKSNGFKVKETLLHRESTSVFAIVVGRKLMLVELVFGETSSFLVLKEIQCGEGVMTIVWLDDSIVLGNISGYFLYSCVTGLGGLIFSLPDPLVPPRLKLLHREYMVLLLVDNVAVTVNAQGQPVGGSLVFRRAPDAVGEIDSCVAVVRSGKLELYHKRSGNCLQVVSFAEGVGQCILADQGANEKLIVVATRSKVVCYKKVPSEDQIKDLLRKKNFVEAVSLVEELQMEGEMTREMLSFVHAQVGFLLLFDLHFEEAVNHFLLSEEMQPSEIFPFIMRDPNRWSLLVPRNRYWGLHPPPVPLENVVDNGLVSIQRANFLKKAGVETVVEDSFLLNPPNRAELLESAIKNIIRYLCVSREKDLSPLVREGVDTLLMYLYRALNRVEDMERLASFDNSCVVEELETLLNDSGHLRTLAFLYASKGMSSKALAIWRVLARNYSSGLWKDPTREMDPQYPTNLNSGKEIAAVEASQILEKSSNQDLVLRHLGWIADIDQTLAIRVITSERTDQLSPDEVIAAIDPKKVDILQRYLQWLIEDQDSEDIQFHTTYALLLAKSAIESFATENPYQDFAAGCAIKINMFAKGNNKIFESSVRKRLQLFLQSSELYDPEEVLDLIEGSELWLEKAILYKRLGQETLVLQILAMKLEDSEAAENYCAEICRPDAYMQLLEIYLEPKDGKEPMFKAAVRLLHNHGESLDPLKVLERLTPAMPLQLASDTILRMLRARVHHYRQGQIEHNLSRAIHVDASVAGLEERSRNVQINDESFCDSCHARLGTKLFAMYPDDSIACYKCFRRLGESKSVIGRDFKRDPMFKAGWLVAP